jgi:hypothetical protein
LQQEKDEKRQRKRARHEVNNCCIRDLCASTHSANYVDPSLVKAVSCCIAWPHSACNKKEKEQVLK